MKYLLTTIAAVMLVLVAFDVAQHVGFGKPENYDLSGKWLGMGYRCGTTSSDQEISITQDGNKVIATKITGDDCVGAGQKTWEGGWPHFPATVSVSTL